MRRLLKHCDRQANQTAAAFGTCRGEAFEFRKAKREICLSLWDTPYPWRRGWLSLDTDGPSERSQCTFPFEACPMGLGERLYPDLADQFIPYAAIMPDRAYQKKGKWLVNIPGICKKKKKV